jgi:hypothetical protein
LATIGCGQEGSGPVATEADSAGIRIVTNERPLEDWVLTDEPEVELGNLAAPGLTEFFQVEAARFLSDEQFVVANRGTEELRFFGTDGAFLGATGGGGRGPEEFQGLSWLAVVGDSLLTYDWGNDRLSVRDHSGTFGRAFRLEWVSGLLRPLALLSDSTLLSLSVRHMTELAGTGTLLDLGLVSRHDLTGAVIDSLGRFPVGERVVHREGNRQTTIRLPLSAVASFASHGDGFCYVFGPEFQVRCLDPQGVPTTIARVESLPRAVTPEDVERAFEHELDGAREAGSVPREQALLRARPSMTFPETLPAFTELLADDQNRIWARRYALPAHDIVEWWIFDDERWVGRVRMDPAFQAMDVRGNRVLGVWRDGLGIEHIRIHRFEAL